MNLQSYGDMSRGRKASCEPMMLVLQEDSYRECSSHLLLTSRRQEPVDSHHETAGAGSGDAPSAVLGSGAVWEVDGPAEQDLQALGKPSAILADVNFLGVEIASGVDRTSPACGTLPLENPGCPCNVQHCRVFRRGQSRFHVSEASPPATFPTAVPLPSRF